MKLTRIFIIPLFLIAPIALAEPEAARDVESEVFSAHGTTREIATRAQSCVAQIVQFQSARRVTGGDVIVSIDLEAGIIVANNRQEFRAMLEGHFVQSTITILAKDGKFKVRHSGIKWLTGGTSNGDFNILYEKSPYASKAKAALVSTTTKLSDCVKKDSSW